MKSAEGLYRELLALSITNRSRLVNFLKLESEYLQTNDFLLEITALAQRQEDLDAKKRKGVIRNDEYTVQYNEIGSDLREFVTRYYSPSE